MNNIKKIFWILFFTTIYTLGLVLFIQPIQLLTTGITGISQIIQHYTGFSYAAIYFIINIPGIFIGYKYIGKKFTYYSFLSIVTVTLLSSLNIINYIPQLTSNLMLNSIFGGILLGYGTGGLLKKGFSSGGTDFYVMYLLKYKNMNFMKVNLIINIIIIVLGATYHSVELSLYTIISLFVRNMVLDNVFTNTNTITLFIIGDKLDQISNFITCDLKRGSTIINNAEGGFTHNSKKVMITTINQYEYTVLCEKLETIDEEIFINVIDTLDVVGNYKKDKGLDKDE